MHLLAKHRGMERETSYLRCSKVDNSQIVFVSFPQPQLSSYVEFNRMVQALSVHRNYRRGEGATIHSLSKGTCAEYNFYQTLAIMLNQVLHNPHPEIQRQELLTIYQWFSLNKPLATPLIKKGEAVKPQIFLTKSKAPHQIIDSRPQTAPAVIGCKSRTATPHCPPPTPAPPVLSFTSSFVTRSLNTPERPTSVPLPKGRGGERREATKESNTFRNSNGVALSSMGITGSSLHSLSSDQDTNRSITPALVISTASSVAAEMTLDRLKSSWQHSQIRRVTKRAATVNGKRNFAARDGVAATSWKEEEESLPKSLSEGALETIAEEGREEVAVQYATEKLKSVSVESSDKIDTKCDERENASDENPVKSETKFVVVIEENKGREQEGSNREPAKVNKEEGGHVTSVRVRKGEQRRTAKSEPNFSNTRVSHRIGIINLALDGSQYPKQQDDKKLSSPKPLATIVAGFNKCKYRPRRVT